MTERTKAIRCQHRMTMTSGLRPPDRPGAPDQLPSMLALPQRNAPRERWAYASARIDLHAITAPTASGTQLANTFNQAIATAIGAAPFAWGTIGAYTGAPSRARTTPRDLARVGYLMMMDGRWPTAGVPRALPAFRRELMSRVMAALVTATAF